MKIKIDPLDTLFSRYIRQRDKICKRCGVNARLQCSHFHGRRKQSVRYDENNAVALCFTCHRYFTENPLEHVEWYRNYLGEEKFEQLNLRANIIGKPDTKLLWIYYKNKLKGG